MRNGTRAAVALTAAAAIGAGSAAVAFSATGFPRFGHTTVRSGIPSGVAKFTVTSPELASGRFPAADYSAGFGCTGSEHEPAIRWSGAPQGTKSFAVTMFDQDAPTGSGLWHQIAWDIPATATSFDGTLPAGAVSGTNDTGATGYLGPCPPVGDIAHRYVISVLALDVPTMGMAAGTPAALESFSMSTHVIGVGKVTATAQR
jgi:Raf kinase inhibitor-like YbhB/YbcL family protein